MNMRMPSRLVCAVRALDSWPAGACMSGLQRSAVTLLMAS